MTWQDLASDIAEEFASFASAYDAEDVGAYVIEPEDHRVGFNAWGDRRAMLPSEKRRRNTEKVRRWRERAPERERREQWRAYSTALVREFRRRERRRAYQRKLKKGLLDVGEGASQS